MTTSRESKETDLILPPNAFAFIQNNQKGEVISYVGPYKSNLDGTTDQPVIFDEKTKAFRKVNLTEAIQLNYTAPEGWYLQLKNPEKNNKFPTQGLSGNVELNIGHKVNLAGPIHFALFPGQMCRCIQGHHLRSNQYLIVRVYDEESAKASWSEAVIKTTEETTEEKNNITSINETDITMGKLFVIKGTEVSFYIPPTSIEVLQFNGQYIQDAVTLERLEYCVLLDEDGNKEYIQGPDVVFPKPTQHFIKDSKGNKKYRAITLNDISGLHIQVTKEYEEKKVKFNVGDELFITGRDNAIYYPREEHAIIKYGTKEKHYATAVPKGEGRYVLNRISGEITLVKGAKMLLPDPRKEVLVKRVLSDYKTKHWFPHNEEARQYNEELRRLQKPETEYVTEEDIFNDNEMQFANYLSTQALSTSDLIGRDQRRGSLSKKFAGDAITRNVQYTKPRSICLESSKFEGAIRIDVWRGYAISVESKSGESKVITGPSSYLLEYDEDLVMMILSRGCPKDPHETLKTPYLRILNNRISDQLAAVTSDLCNVLITLSYNVDFDENLKDKWFNVENYIQFLCERMRSMIQRLVKQHKIEDFHQKHVDLVRDLVLDRIPTEANKGINKNGRLFNENGMRITDVEVSPLIVGDAEISNLLEDAQSDIIRKNLKMSGEDRRLELVKKEEETKKAISTEQSSTIQEQHKLTEAEVRSRLDIDLAQVDVNNQVQIKEKENEEKLQSTLALIEKAKIERSQLSHEEEQEHKKALVAIDGDKLKKESEAYVERFKAMTPELIAAIQNLGDKNIAIEISRNLSPYTILGDKNLSKVLTGALKGTSLGNNLEQLLNGYDKLQEVSKRK
jgi:major vault protein